MKSLDLFLPQVGFAVLGAPEPLIQLAVRNACIEFCRRTDLVQRVQTAVDIVAGTQDYAIVAPTDMEPTRVLGVAWQGRWLTPVAPGDVHSDVALRGVAIGTATPLAGDPAFFFQKTPDADTVSLYPIPSTSLTGGLLVKMAYAPTATATTVDDTLVDEWAEGIAAGAIARVQSVPGQSFSANPTVARGTFEMAISAARRRALVGKQVAGLRVQPRRFA